MIILLHKLKEFVLIKGSGWKLYHKEWNCLKKISYSAMCKKKVFFAGNPVHLVLCLPHTYSLHSISSFNLKKTKNSSIAFNLPSSDYKSNKNLGYIKRAQQSSWLMNY